MKPLNQTEVNTLGKYNAEVARGIMHRVAWQEEMHRLQERFEQTLPHDSQIIGVDLNGTKFEISLGNARLRKVGETYAKVTTTKHPDGSIETEVEPL